MTFPNGPIDVLTNRFAAVLGEDYAVVKRAVRPIDPYRTLGVFLDSWEPVEGSHLIGQWEPALALYRYSIQFLLISPDEEQGLAEHSVTAKLIKAILYRDEPLRLALTSITEEHQGSVERLKRFGVTRQSFRNTSIKGHWDFLVTTGFWIETETTKLN